MPIPRTVARLNRYITNPILGRLARFMSTFGFVHHVGRKSGEAYRTPVLFFRDGDQVVIALTYTSKSDWVKNVLAAGECSLESRGETVRLGDPVLETDREKTWAPWPMKMALRLIRVDEVLRFRVG